MKAKQVAKEARLLDEKQRDKENREKRRKRKKRAWIHNQTNGHKRSKFD